MTDPAARERAMDVQRQFEDQFAADPNVLGIGLAANAAGDGVALQVQVSQPPAAGTLPERFGELEVIVIVVGSIEPQ